MHSAQSSSKCKNYVLKVYSQLGNFLNTIQNISLEFIFVGDPMIKSLNKFSRKLMPNLVRNCAYA